MHVSTGKTLLLHFIQAEADAILKGEKSKNQLVPSLPHGLHKGIFDIIKRLKIRKE